MSLLGHLEELRVRLVRCILAAVAGFAVCFAFAERILEILLHPLKQVLPPKSELITTGLTEGFFVSMKAAFVAGLFLVSPVIFYQIWKFVAPGLYEEERRLAVPVAFFTALCFVSGACFGYFVVFPFGFTFLANYAADVVTLMPKLSEYYSFSLSLLFAFGIIFEMPVFIFFLARFGVVDHTWLRKKRRWAIVLFFVVAAILTPTPDAVNQILMAAPMAVLYEVSIWVAYFFGKKKPAPSEETLPATTGGGDESAGGGTPAGPVDSALDEAHASENPQLEETKSLEKAGDAVSGREAAPEQAAPPRDAEVAEREAHEQAALGHDMDEAVASTGPTAVESTVPGAETGLEQPAKEPSSDMSAGEQAGDGSDKAAPKTGEQGESAGMKPEPGSAKP